VDAEWDLGQDVLVAEVGLLKAEYIVSSRSMARAQWHAYLSVVNFPSLCAAMNLSLNLYAFKLRPP
jgi:hypothetical protein